MTVHNGNVVTAPLDEWTTVLDVSAATTLVGGSIYAQHVVYRLTVDGNAVIDSTANAAGRDSAGDVFMTQAVPPTKAEESLTVEVTPKGSSPSDVGWRLYTL